MEEAPEEAVVSLCDVGENGGDGDDGDGIAECCCNYHDIITLLLHVLERLQCFIYYSSSSFIYLSSLFIYLLLTHHNIDVTTRCNG